jgi:hypothetical protein
MRVNVTQKLLSNSDVFRLSDLHLVRGDLAIARDNFESSLRHAKARTNERNLVYALNASALIHYRRAFDRTGHRRAFITDKIVRQCTPELHWLHRKLISLSNKHIAHSENEYEQCLVTILVAEDDEGRATFRGLGMQATAIALLSEAEMELAAKLVNELIERHLLPEIGRLEEVVKEYCKTLSPSDLRNLPDGFAPPGSSNPQTRRTWPHPGKY